MPGTEKSVLREFLRNENAPLPWINVQLVQVTSGIGTSLKWILIRQKFTRPFSYTEIVPKKKLQV